ncbi:Crp/Fnr family transcriptional regulator [Aquabacterium sp. OR-4]|uniref:Crp/Fnr family transcriptional regulator n=1 Tax=Aquabacterium sp. OR-4 TaxID=2978127 RepID=UPI0021B2B867|nr:Crp/Fnr family transcriptional regulator [Aquabacterium sp. OR-4]MDT7837610.1 Crp/Fnr family transcriptional regulator [Aquabacterium sp. OR-4]
MSKLRLRERARAPTDEELRGIPWLWQLDEADRQEALAHLSVGEAQPGERICRTGAPSNFWFGVVGGLLKMSNDTREGGQITYTGVPPGAWFGEGTLLKREIYRYNIEALRVSTVAGLPCEVFHRLLDRSIPFNRFVMNQINERLGQFIAAREIDRDNQPDARVARSLASLFHPVLYPGVGQLLRITQQELAWLIGLSRQRVNQALTVLQAAALIRVEYGGVRVLDLDGLRRYRIG